MDAERHNVWAAAALAVLAALYLMLFRPGYSVMGGGDFALYLAHAQAIADFRPYAATGFVFNPANAIMSPAAYPPGLPLLLASLLAMLWGLHRLALPTLGPRWSAVLVLAAGLSPAILMRRDAIGSDMPFAAWCMLALVGARGRPALLAIGVAMAILTRSIGIVLAAAIALDLVFRPAPVRRRLLPALVAGTAVALVGMLWLRVDNATYAGYFDRMTAAGLVRHFIDAGQAYASALVELFGLSFGRLANYPVLAAGAILIAAGLVQRLRRGPDAITFFVILYIAALIAYPVHMEPTRYALPVLPLLLLAFEFAAPRLGRAGPVIALAIIAVLYVPFYAQHNATRRGAAQRRQPGIHRADQPHPGDPAGHAVSCPQSSYFRAVRRPPRRELAGASQRRRPARHLDPVPPGLSHRGEMAAWRRSGDARPAGRGIPGHLRKPSLPPARYSRRSTRSLRNLDIPLARKSRRSASSSYSSRTQSRNATRPSPSAW